MLEAIALPIKQQLGDVEEIIGKRIVSGVPLATDVVRYTTRSGGKRIRPAVFLLAARLAGAPAEGLPSIGAAMELIHTASLLHDDVIDEARMRRGRAAACSRWGNQISVLVGDLMWCAATSLMLESAPSRLIRSVSRAITATTEGELLEITRQNDHTIDRRTYLAVIEGKTAALFGVCAAGGAIMAGLSRQREQTLERYGYHLGMAFQLVDDILDYTCPGAAMGKAPGGDFRSGTLTLPLIVALERANPGEAACIRSALVSNAVDDKEFADVIDIIARRGGIDAAAVLAREHADAAKQALAAFKPSIERESLVALSDYVVWQIHGCG